MRHVWFALLSLPLLISVSAAAQVERNVSEVTGVERLESTEMRSLIVEQYSGHASFQAEYERHPEDGQSWQLSFYGFAEHKTGMSRTNEVRLQVDGKTVTPLRIESKTRTLDTSVLEIKQVGFSRSAFTSIATAETVTITIGPASFELTHPLRKDMRLILERVPPGQAPSTASTDSLNDE